jgi:selenocysteine-specific elongation factor
MEPPRRLVVGTAGHIDHGKSLLVRSLTGTDPDRLKEEKERGITIDLGFASLLLEDGTQVGFVDVPGHERFVRNMLAGVGGIDLVLLVIAADESIKPQTREHFEICRLLGLRRGIVALTKSDLVDPEVLDLVRLEVREYLSGSFLQDAPVVPVSSKTGAGLEPLKQALAAASSGIATRPEGRVFRLPVDRSFSIRGFGTVVTGTLMSGRVSVGDEVEILPHGSLARVRGLEVFGKSCRKALAGQRTAVNLHGVDPTSVVRGDILAPRGVLPSTRLLDVRLEMLEGEGALEDLAPIRFHHLASEVMGRVRLAGAKRLQSGSAGFAQIRLSRMIAALPGDRFILRRPSPPATVGGGIILDNLPRKLRAPDIAALEIRLSSLQSPDPSVSLKELVRGAGLSGADLAALRGRTGWDFTALLASLAPLVKSGQVVQVQEEPPRYLESEIFERSLREMIEMVETFHREQPLQVGLLKEEIRSRLFRRVPADVFRLFLEEAARRKRLRVDQDRVALAGHRVELQGEEAGASQKIEDTYRIAGLNPPEMEEIMAKLALSRKTLENIYFLLLKQGRLIRIKEGRVFHAEALEVLKKKLWEYRRTSDLVDISTFKDLSGTTRKNAIPLLEHLDAIRVTRRDGNVRRILPPPSSP